MMLDDDYDSKYEEAVQEELDRHVGAQNWLLQHVDLEVLRSSPPSLFFRQLAELLDQYKEACG